MSAPPEDVRSEDDGCVASDAEEGEDL